MPGSLALVGSGEYLPQMSELELSLINDGIALKKDPIYIQIPTAAAQEGDRRLRYWQELGQQQAERIGIEPRFLPIYTREDAFKSEYIDLIDNAALVYFSGGDPHYLAKTLVDTPLWQKVYVNFTSGTSLAGCSAGAMVMSSHIPHFRLSKNELTKGLNLLPNIRVIPHFDKFFRWIPDSVAKMLMEVSEKTILLGIDEMTALIRRSNSDTWQVYGNSQVHILSGLPRQKLSAGEQLVIHMNGAPRQD